MLYPSQRNRNIWRRQPLSGCLWVYKAQQWSLELGENLKKPRLPRKKLIVFFFLKKKSPGHACAHSAHLSCRLACGLAYFNGSLSHFRDEIVPRPSHLLLYFAKGGPETASDFLTLCLPQWCQLQQQQPWQHHPTVTRRGTLEACERPFARHVPFLLQIKLWRSMISL